MASTRRTTNDRTPSKRESSWLSESRWNSRRVSGAEQRFPQRDRRSGHLLWCSNSQACPATVFTYARLTLMKRRQIYKQKKKNKARYQNHTMKGLTCNGFAARSDLGSKENITLSPHGVFVTWNQNCLLELSENKATTLVELNPKCRCKRKKKYKLRIIKFLGKSWSQFFCDLSINNNRLSNKFKPEHFIL